MLVQILEILKYILPSVVVLIATTMIVNKFLVKEIERKQLSIFAQNSDSAMKLRLQAYERLTIFVERMNAKSLISRYYVQQATAQDVQIAMVQGIRAEYEHNLSQQLYVSHEVWQTITTVMEQEITMINRIGASCEMGASATEFIKKISEYIVNTESTIPTDIALETLNKEAKRILFNS
jgi:Na+/H+-translocating membrane pyrophosphatase